MNLDSISINATVSIRMADGATLLGQWMGRHSGGQWVTLKQDHRDIEVNLEHATAIKVEKQQ